MSRSEAILYTLVSYQALLLAIGLWASRRTRDREDFFLGGRALGPWVAAISASASSSSAWTLLSVSGMAYLWGLPALWLFPATLLGFLVNWLWIAPRLQRMAAHSGDITLTGFLAGPPDAPGRERILVAASAIVLFSFLFYIAAQFQAAGNAFASAFDLEMGAAVAVGAAVVLVYTLLGGFWAVSVTDTLQGLLMAATAIVLPAIALAAVGGWSGLVSALDISAVNPAPTQGSLPAAVGFVAGTLGIGLGYPGQPHVVNRFMALRDERSLARARLIAIGWAVIIYSGMLLLGLCARGLFAGVLEPEAVLFEVADRLIAPVVAGVMIAAVLSAIMSTADSQLLVAASSVTEDLGRTRGRAPSGLGSSRVVVALLCVLAASLALLVPDTIFRRVLFAWHAVGSAFGPLLVMILLDRRPSSARALASIVTGFSLTVALHWLPDTPGDWAERLVPLAAAWFVAAGWLTPAGRP